METGELIYSSLVSKTGINQIVTSIESISQLPLIATCSHDGQVKMIEMQSGKIMMRVKSSVEAPSRAVALVEARRSFLVAACGRQIWLWDMSTKIPIEPLCGHSGDILCLAVYRSHPDYATALLPAVVVTGDDRHEIRVWDLESPFSMLRCLVGHKAPVLCVKVIVTEEDPVAKFKVLSGSADKSFKIWNLLSGECLHSLEGHIGPISTLSVLELRVPKTIPYHARRRNAHAANAINEALALLFQKKTENMLNNTDSAPVSTMEEFYIDHLVVTAGLDKKVIFWRLRDCILMHKMEMELPVKGSAAIVFPRPYLMLTAGENGLVILDLGLCDDLSEEISELISKHQNFVKPCSNNVDDET